MLEHSSARLSTSLPLPPDLQCSVCNTVDCPRGKSSVMKNMKMKIKVWTKERKKERKKGLVSKLQIKNIWYKQQESKYSSPKE